MSISRNSIFKKGAFYHIYNRGIDSKAVFDNEADRDRFLFYMYAANIGRPNLNIYREDTTRAVHAILNGLEPQKNLITREHPPLVNILSFILVRDHFHLLVSPYTKNGISKYTQKMKTAFSKYFNNKHHRTGNVFERPYRLVLCKDDVQLARLIFYINIKNAIDVWKPDWKKLGVGEWNDFFDFLEQYPYSSFQDLFGARTSLLMGERQWINDCFAGGIALTNEELKKLTKNYLEKKKYHTDPIFIELS